MQVALPKGINDLFDEKNEAIIRAKTPENVQAGREQKNEIEKITSMHGEASKRTSKLIKKQQAILTISRKPSAKICKKQLSEANTEDMNLPAIPKLLHTDISETLESHETTEEKDAIFTPTTSSYKSVKPYITKNEKIREREAIQLRTKRQKSKAVLILKRPILADVDLKANKQDTIDVTGNVNKAPLRPVDEDLKSNIISDELENKSHRHHCDITLKTSRDYTLSYMEQTMKASTSELQEANELSDSEETKKVLLTKKLKEILFIQSKDSSKQLRVDDEYKGQEGEEQEILAGKEMQKPTKINKKSKAVHTLKSTRKEIPQTENIQKMNDSEVPQSSINSMRTASRSTKVSLLSSKIKNEKTPPSTQKVKCKAIITLKNTNQIDSKTSKKPSDSIIKNIDTTTMPKEGTLTKLQRRKSLLGVKSKKATRTQQINERNKAIAECNETAIETQDILPITNDSIKQDITKMSIGELVPCKKSKVVLTINTFEPRKSETIDNCGPHKSAKLTEGATLTKFDKMHKLKAIITLKKSSQVYDAKKTISDVTGTVKTKEVDNVSLEETSEKNQKETKLLTNKRTAIVVSKKTKKLEKETKNEANNVECFMKLKDTEEIKDKTIAANRHSQNISRNENIKRMIETAYRIYSESASHGQPVGRKQKAIITVKPVSEMKSIIGTVPKPNIDSISKYVNVEKQKNTNKKKSHKTFDETISATLDYAIIDSGPSTDKIKETSIVDASIPRKPKKVQQTNNKKIKAILTKKPVANIEIKKLRRKSEVENKSPTAQIHCKNSTLKSIVPKKGKALLTLKRSQKIVKASELSEEMTSKNSSVDPDNKIARSVGADYVHPQKEKPIIRKSKNVETNGKKKAVIKLMQSNINNTEMKTRQTSKELCDTIAPISILDEIKEVKSTENTKPLKEIKRLIVHTTENVPIHTFDMNAQPRFDVRKKVAVLTLKSLKTAVISIKDNQAGKYSNEMIRKKQIDNKLRNNINETVELNRVNEELVKTKNVIPLNKDIKKQKVILKWRQPATSFMCLKKESLANPIQRITGDVKYILPEVRIQKPAICKVNMSKKQIAVLKLKQAAIDNKFSPVIAKTIVPERSAPIWETHLIKGIESTQLADTINIEKSYHKKKQIDVLNLKNVYYVKAEHIPERAETSEQVSRKDINTNRECNMAYVPVDANVGNVFKYNYGNRLRTKQTAMITLRKPIISEKINSIIENKEMPIELHSQRTKEEVDIDKPKVKKRLRSDIVNKKDKPIEIKSLRKQTLPITEPVAHRTTEKHNLKKKKAILTIAPTTFDHLCENAKTVKTNESHQTKETKSTSSIKHASELLEESTKSRKQKAVLTLQAIVHRSDTNNTIFPSTVNSEKVPDNEKNINYSCILPEIKEEKLLDVCVKSSNKKKQAVLKLRQSKMSAVYSRASQLEQNETVSEAYETRHANELMYKPFHVSAASRNHENITEKHKATLVLRKKALLLSLKEIRANVSAESFHSNKKNVSLKESSVGNLQFTESDNQRRKHKVIITLKDIFNTSAYQTYLETKKEARSHEGIIFTADKNKNKSVVDTKSAECEKISIIKTPLMQRIENNEVELPDESVIIEYVKVKPAQEVHSHTKPKAVLTIKLQKANQPIKLVSSKTINSRQMEHDGVVSTSRKKEKLTAVLTLQKFEVVKITELPRLQIKNKNSIRNTNEVKETSSKQKTKRNSFDANEMRFKKSKAILTLIQSRRHQGSMASKTKIAEKKLTTIHAMHRTLEIENVPINRFIDIKAKDNIVIQTTKENDPKKAIAFVSETTDVKQNQETACETFREHLLRTKTLHQKKKAIVTLKCLTRNNRNEAINMWNKIAAEKENESTICAGVVSKQSVIDKRHELVAKKHNAVLIMKTKYNKRTRIQDRNSCLSDVKTNEMSRGLDMPQFNIARNIQPFEFTQVKQPTVKKQKAIITQRQPKNLKNVEKPIMSKMMTSNVPILQTLSDNNEISPSSIIKDEKKIQEKKKRRAILTLRQKKSKSQSLGLMAMPSHKRVSKSIAVETDISLLAKRSFSETSSIIRDPDNVLQHVEILSKPIAVLYLKRKNKWINADYAYYANKSAQSTMRACKNQIRKKSADLKSVAQMSGFQSSECTMQSFADEFSDTKCTLNVSLMRCASYDFACTVFLGYRTRHFVPVGQRDGPVILPRSLFLDSLSSSNVFSFPAVDRNQQKGGNQSVRKTNEVVKDDKNESNETEEEEEEEDESEKYHEMGRNDNFLHNRKGLNAILCSAEKRRNKLSLLFQRDEVTSEKKETENKRVHGEDSWKESRKHNFFSINIKSGEQTNLLPFSSFSFFKSHDQLAAKQTHAKTSYDSAPTSYDEGSFSSDNSANKIQRSPVTYIVNKQIPAVLNVSTDKAEVNPVLFNPTVTMHSNNSTEGPTMRRSRSSILQSLLQKFSQKKSKNVGEGSIKKKEAKSKVEKAARKESGVDISSPSSTSSSSSSSSSDAEEVVEQPPQRNDIAEETERTGESPPYKLTSSVSAGPYALAPVDGRIIREETIEQVYRIVGGAGERIPHVDPANASLLGIVSKCVAETTSAPKVTYVEERSVVRDHGAIPDLIIKEASLPHSTVHTWHETSAGPETVTTEVDEHGNVVKRTVVKSEQVKHTVRTQSYQTFVVDENTAPNESSVTEKTPHSSPSKRSGISENTSSPPTTTTVAHTIAYENGAPADVTNTHQWTNGGAVRSTTSEFTEDDLVSTKAVTTGNRTVETLTYKKKKDGVMETHVEHRITIHGGDDIDHDAELSRAILEATNMNPEMTVEKVEVRQKKSIS